MNGHIVKPIDIEKLGAVILSVLKKQENLQTRKNNSMSKQRKQIANVRFHGSEEGKNEQKNRKTDKKRAESIDFSTYAEGTERY